MYTFECKLEEKREFCMPSFYSTTSETFRQQPENETTGTTLYQNATPERQPEDEVPQKDTTSLRQIVIIRGTGRKQPGPRSPKRLVVHIAVSSP